MENCYERIKLLFIGKSMKPLTLSAIIFLTSFSHLHALDGNVSNTVKTNISIKEINVIAAEPLKKRKKSKSFYKKIEDTFSDYDKTWVEDMMTYSADVMLPDELIRASKDVLKNRSDKGFSSKLKYFPKTLGTDAYNLMFTTTYYYIQDISHITKKAWEDELCDPDTFIYQVDKEPQKPLLDLKMTDPEARGMSKNGVILPVNANFPNAFYPYASKPDGCSAEGLQKLYNQANDLSDDDKWLSEACDAHDRCYYTLGTTSKECNEKFIIDSLDSCDNISGRNTLLYMGSKNAFCGFKAFAVSTGANSCAQKYFETAQREQMIYEQWIERYEKSYLKVKQKKHDEARGK